MSDQNNKTKTEKLDRTCVEKGRFIERRDGGIVKGTKRSGKPRKGMISYLKEAFGKKKDEKSGLENRQNKGSREKSDGYVEMRRMAGDRDRWRSWVPGT